LDFGVAEDGDGFLVIGDCGRARSAGGGWLCIACLLSFLAAFAFPVPLLIAYGITQLIWYMSNKFGG